jgi:hypothetical protein
MPAHQGKISTSTEEEKTVATRATYPDGCSPGENQHLDRRRKNCHGQRGPRILMPAHQGKISTSTEEEKTFTGNAGRVS